MNSQSARSVSSASIPGPHGLPVLGNLLQWGVGDILFRYVDSPPEGNVKLESDETLGLCKI
jgi:hypothetical protein